jgi:hypothetical protein
VRLPANVAAGAVEVVLKPQPLAARECARLNAPRDPCDLTVLPPIDRPGVRDPADGQHRPERYRRERLMECVSYPV